ncbi:MAG TPA: hypothetical protein VFP74_13495 [Pseudolabrys sp.]|jgi:hypothetical protein|nr:hypothetical protein [Pseudolabrys sp.]
MTRRYFAFGKSLVLFYSRTLSEKTNFFMRPVACQTIGISYDASRLRRSAQVNNIGEEIHAPYDVLRTRILRRGSVLDGVSRAGAGESEQPK